MSPKTTYHPGASLVALARARGIFGWLLLAAIAIFGVASAHANFFSLHSFSGSDGAEPFGNFGLVQGSDGNFYGTTYSGGTGGVGTVFKITSGGSLTTLYSFSGSDGAYPQAGLVQGSDGNFYGTTSGFGASGS